MRVAVTGGTGFVGSHTVSALVDAGHEVRLLIREPGRLQEAFEPRGLEVPNDSMVGDVTSAFDVETLLDGCNAVVHAGSIYSLDVRDAAAIAATNVNGTRLVIENARRLRLDPIVHVSSIAALLPSDRPLGPDSPVSSAPTGPYGRSKAGSEEIARRHQEDGAPVVTVMPGTVWGPHDPHFGESNRFASDFLRGRLRAYPRGAAAAVVDVRDVAAAIATAIQPGMGPRRYALAPHHLPLGDVAAALNRVTGRQVRSLALPDRLVRAAVTPAGWFQRVAPGRLPFNTESVNAALGWTPVNSSRASQELGIEWRRLDDTLAATLTSMVERGQLEAKHAGVLGESRARLR